MKKHRHKVKGILAQHRAKEDLPLSPIGRPQLLEEQQPGLQLAIIECVNSIAAADPRRRTETLHVCLTLDELKKRVEGMGYSISRSALYTRSF